MELEEKLRRAAGAAALVVCALALVLFAGVAVGADPLRNFRIDTPAVPAGVALALLFLGASLWLQRRGQFPRAGLACAGVAFALAADRAAECLFDLGPRLDTWLAPRGANLFVPGPTMSLHTSLAVAFAAVTVASLAQRRRRGRWPLSAWCANILIAVSVAALMALAFKSATGLARPLRIGMHPALALLLIGGGTLLARPEDKFVRLPFAPGTAGVLARRLFFGAAIVPVVLTAVLLGLVQGGFMELGDGVILLSVGLIVCGFGIALFSTGAAVTIEENREEAQQARLLLTARLQQQAAQLQETVGQRTLELREANASLRAAAESNALLALVAEHTTNGVIITDEAGRTEWANAAISRMTGYPLEELKNREPGAVLQGPGTDPATAELLRTAEQNAEPCHVDLLNYTKQGRPFWAAVDLQPVRDRNGRVANTIALVVDITETRAAQQRQASLHGRLALATRAAALGVWEWDAATQRSSWDARTLEIYGLTADTYSGTSEEWKKCLHPDDRTRALGAFAEVLAGGNEFDQEFRIVRASDGVIRHIQSRAIVQRDAAGQLVRLTGTERDITEEREVAHRSETLNERLRLALRSSNYGVWELDIATDRLVWDERTFEIYGVDRASFGGRREVWRQCLHPADAPHAIELARRVIGGEQQAYDNEFRIIRDGAVRHIEVHGYLQRDTQGRPLRLVGLNRDITERKLLEERVRKSEELAAAVSTIAQIGGWEYDVETARLTWTDGVRRIHEVEDDFQPTLENTRRFYAPDALETLQGAFHTSDRDAPAFDYELPLLTATGRQRWVRVLGRAEFRPDGRPFRVHGAMQDISVRHENEEQRRELETQLFQAQKMETLGTLAGGIAHDFNNLLTGIIGYHELAADSVPEDHPARACLNEARNASLRARELVEQILTFGRQSPGGGHVPIELGPIAEEARRFLRSTLPAMINVELHVAADLPPVLGDATQIHQVLLNLGSNAAHAMRHHGGTLTLAIEPANISTELAHLFSGGNGGTFVRLSVRDTGHGMDEATRRRIFDPFFTTKNTREGTGLGLAVVHGIVRAHRGAIDVESKPGAGAVFHIYLPAAMSDNDLGSSDAPEAPRGAGEVIGIVDDEEVVGTCTRLVLESKGYIATVYRSAEEALAVLQADPGSCSLLVTDQTMPGMQGTELVAAVRKKRPDLPVVIMSGYFSKISPDELDELGQVELLAKPFTTDELSNAVYRALHAAVPAKASA